jgi:hypothetical protein
MDLAVESTEVAYAIDAGGCSKTSNAGASWGSKKPLNIAGYMMTLAPNGDILIGGSDGYVAFSTDGGSSFTATEKMVGDVAGNVIVVADKDYETNSYIYAANDAATTGSYSVTRGALSKTMSFSTRGPSINTTATGNWTVVGMAEADGLIYALTTDGADSNLWRALDPHGDTAALCYWSHRSTGNEYTLTPHALKVSEGPKFWMCDTVGTNDLDSIGDPIAVESPELTGPADADKIPVNPQTGRAYTVTFNFNRYASKYITGLQIQVATNTEFTSLIQDVSVTVDADAAGVTIGPNGVYAGEFMPGMTYYWRVRVNDVDGDTMLSPWSETRSFTVEELVPVTVLSIQAPASGAIDVGLLPAYSWTAVEGAIAYEFVVATDPAFEPLSVAYTYTGSTLSPKSNVFQPDHELEYGTTYYWKVRAVTVWKTKTVTGIYSDWVNGVFTTIEAPAAPPAERYTCPACGLVFDTQQELADHYAKYHAPAAPTPAIPQYMLWVIIVIGAVLIIALIVLIVRTRRAV